MNKKPFPGLSRTIFIALFCLGLFVSAQALAANKTALLTPPTTSRGIGFLFYKLAGRTPDFDKAAMENDAYQKADPASRAQMLPAQRAALQTEFAGTDPEKQMIVIRTAVNMKAKITGKPSLVVTLPMQQGPIYFPYQWSGYNFAVIPDMIEAFLDIPLDITAVSAANSKIGGGSVTMVLELRPTKADLKPMTLDGTKQWLLLTKIAGITYYNQYLQPIWSWQSPDFVRADSSSLQDLKK